MRSKPLRSVLIVVGIIVCSILSGCTDSSAANEITSLKSKVELLEGILSDKQSQLIIEEEKQGLKGVVWDSEEVDALQEEIEYIKQKNPAVSNGLDFLLSGSTWVHSLQEWTREFPLLQIATLDS